MSSFHVKPVHGKINTRPPEATAETTATTLSNNVADDIIAYRVQFTNGPCVEDDSSLAAFTHSSSNGYTIINPVRYYDVDDGLPPTMLPEWFIVIDAFDMIYRD